MFVFGIMDNEIDKNATFTDDINDFHKRIATTSAPISFPVRILDCFQPMMQKVSSKRNHRLR